MYHLTIISATYYYVSAEMALLKHIIENFRMRHQSVHQFQNMNISRRTTYNISLNYSMATRSKLQMRPEKKSNEPSVFPMCNIYKIKNTNKHKRRKNQSKRDNYTLIKRQYSLWGYMTGQVLKVIRTNRTNSHTHTLQLLNPENYFDWGMKIPSCEWCNFD